MDFPRTYNPFGDVMSDYRQAERTAKQSVEKAEKAEDKVVELTRKIEKLVEENKRLCEHVRNLLVKADCHPGEEMD